MTPSPAADGKLNIEKAIEKLRTNHLAVFKINALTRRGREDLMALFAAAFVSFNLNPEHLFSIFSAVAEVIFNGIKANAKFILFKEELRKKLINHSHDDLDTVLDIIFREEPLRDFVTRYVMPDKIKRQVANVLKLEERARVNGTAQFSDADKEALVAFRKKLEESEVNIHFTIGITPYTVVFTVVNDSPVLAKDAQRIEASRKKHQMLSKEGRSPEFFGLDNLDTTESAGFGIGMADEVYYQMGLDPFEYFTISVENKLTSAVMKFPREKITG